MSTVFENTAILDDPALAALTAGDFSARHRIREVCERQGVTLRTAARRLGVEMCEVRRQLDEQANLSLDELYAWHCILGVPVSELLVDSDDPLSSPVLQRTQLLKVMKTAVTIHESADRKPIERLATMLIQQLLDIMPELAEVGPWHGSGHGRDRSEGGRQFETPANWE